MSIEQDHSCKGVLKSVAHTEVQKYLDNLSDTRPSNLHHMVLAQVEEPLLKQVMDYCHNNQTQAARLLGISRTTLKKKLQGYNLLS